MKRLLWLLLPLLVISLTGCKDDGTLVVRSASEGWINVAIDGILYELDPWDTVSSTWSLSTSILGNDSKTVLVQYSGLYVFSGYTRVSVEAGSTRKLTIYSDGGAIRIYNDSSIFTIEEAYLSPSEDSSWGNDDLNGTIEPGEYVTWTVSPGYWDIKVVDDWGDEFYSYDNYIYYEETQGFYYTGFRAIREDRKTDVAESSAETARCEQRESE